MKNGKLLPVLTDFLQCSAFLPSTLEFSCFWTTVLERLQAPAPDGWGEPAMHDYMKREEKRKGQNQKDGEGKGEKKS
jgi:hypothetical protein